MDRENNQKNKDEYLKDLQRARLFFERAVSLLETDLETAANRIYLSFENLCHGFLKWKHSQVSKKHAQIWEKMSKLYLQGIVSFDVKPYLIKSYQFHLYVDYGRNEFKGEKTTFSKEKVEELLENLKKILLEIENIVKK